MLKLVTSAKMSVKISGPVLSSLFFEQNNCDSDGEGFLLGQIHSHVTNMVTDTQMNSVKEETVTYVHAFVPCPTMYSWYRSSGEVEAEKLKTILKNNKHKEVVGWYRFRRNTSTDVISLREHCIHRHLMETAFPGVVAQNFLFFLCSGSASINGSTHTFDHTFLSYNGRSFKGVPVSIINLGDTPQSQYRHQPSNAINSERGRFAQTVKSFQDQFCDNQGKMHSVSGVQTFNTVIATQLTDLCETVATSERQLELLTQDVEELEKKLARTRPPPPPPAHVSPQLMRRNCYKPKGTAKNPMPSPTPSPEPIDDLIMLDDEEKDFRREKSLPLDSVGKTTVEIHQVPILNPKVAEYAPVMAKTKMAANFGKLPGKSDAVSVSAPLLQPKKSTQEPSVSASVQKSADKNSQQSEQKEQKTKKSDSFSFVDDLLAEQKTLTRSNSKRGNKSMKTGGHEGEGKGDPDKSQGRGARAKTTNQGQGQKGIKSQKQDIEGPSTTFDAEDPVEMEVSSSPTF